MAIDTDSLINEVSDPNTRRALKAVFDEVKADQAANKAAFDDHTHYIGGTSVYSSKPASESPGNTTGTRETFQQNLK